ncbi:MAG TPA: substrate-binding domain-containing protein [Puia sp.]|jgi:LacI family transcriptional regulator|nr:substrate-binding domain-containing protein [Puia sp.]
MSKKVLLKDIALKAGVSITLVSYVLNKQKVNRINKETAQKIRDIAANLNYRTNQVAKSLKTNKTFTIGIVVADISNPFSANLARIIEDEADKHNYTVIFGSSDENASKFVKLVDTFINRQVDGLILSPPSNSENQIEYLQKLGFPFVLLDRYFKDIKTSYVALDNYKASHEAVNHLIKTGRNRIGMITYKSDLFHLKERKRGYLSALKENRISFERGWLKEIDISNNRSEIENAINEIISSDPLINAVLFGSNNIATISLKYINSLPIKVPRDLAIISFDQTDMLDLFYAPVTYIKQPLKEMGEIAIKILLKEINDTNAISQVNMNAELVIRESTGISIDGS